MTSSGSPGIALFSLAQTEDPMSAATLPPDEAQRLSSLRRLEVLDTPPDSVLDGLTRCAAQICACPISLVTLVDAERQWFKSRVGIEAEQSAREMGFCDHAIRGADLLEVPNALEDPRFASNPLVQGEPNIRFYAGVPIFDENQQLGALCVIDRVPRLLTAAQKDALIDLAKLASAWFSARREHLELQQQRARAEIQLARLQGIAQQVPGMIFEYRQAAAEPGHFGYVSDRARDLLEIEPAALLTTPDLPDHRVHPDDRSRLKASLERAGRQRLPWTQEFRVQLPRGGVQWRMVQAAPSPGPDGEVHWHGLLTDVSQQRAREAEIANVRNRWQLAVKAAQLGLITLHLDAGRVELDALARLHHGLPEQGASLRLEAWLALFEIDADSREALLSQIQGMVPGQTLSLACEIPATPTAALRRLEVVAQARAAEASDEAGIIVIGTCRDVTAQHHGEQARRQLLAAEQTSREKNLFLSRLSHELRTPLNAILGFTQLLQADAQEPLSPRQQAQVRHTHEAGRLLLNLINDVLDLSAGQDARRLAIGPVNVKDLVLACEPMVSQMACAAGVSIEIVADDDLPPALADALALKQVLLNLMTNAVKYNRKGGRLRVAVDALPETLQIVVSDEGLGLNESQLARLFQPFDRLGAEQSRTEGTGLGLLITRELVEAMHGSVRVHSVPDHGSAFTVELPAFQAARPLERAHAADGAAQQGVETTSDDAAPAAAETRETILLYIEDEPVNALLVQESLRAHPHLKLTVAPDGPTGLAMARALRPALVLSDINLPGLSGLEVVRALRADGLEPRMVCIALSADAMGEQIDAALQAGFDDYWTKPVDLVSVPARIEGWLRTGRRPAAAEEQA